MSEGPWLTIVGLGEDGPEGLSVASLSAIEEAEIVMGPPRHMALLGKVAGEAIEWPVPFADGLAILDGYRGRRVVVLTSGDPFWFGAGSVLAGRYDPGEWRVLPGVSVFSLAAARLGWALEKTQCLGLHAAPLERLKPRLAPGVRVISTVRDGASARALALWLTEQGFGASVLHVLEAMGGPRERMRSVSALAYDLEDVRHPVAVAFEVAGDGSVLSCVSGQADAVFENDGQITKRPVRALTLSALGPRPGETLWDIGAGSGSVALEWMMADPSNQAVAIEARADRADRIRSNAAHLGQDRLQIIMGEAPDALSGLSAPDAVFVGGGLNEALLAWLEANLAQGTRIVANAVTLETEALLVAAAARRGGHLLKVQLAEAQPLGRFRGWKAAYPVVQWSVTL